MAAPRRYISTPPVPARRTARARRASEQPPAVTYHEYRVFMEVIMDVGWRLTAAEGSAPRWETMFLRSRRRRVAIFTARGVICHENRKIRLFMLFVATRYERTYQVTNVLIRPRFSCLLCRGYDITPTQRSAMHDNYLSWRECHECTCRIPV